MTSDQAAIHAVIYVAIWICMSSSVILYNKYILHFAGFPFPIILTTWHMIFSALATRILAKTTNLMNGLQTLNITWEIYLKAIMPIGLLFSASLVLCNYAYLYLSVAFIQMIKATTPVVVLLIGWWFQTERPNRLLLVNVLIIVTGVVVACYGEIEFVLIGFIFQALGVIVEAMRLVMVQQLLNSKSLKMDPLCSLYYFAPVCGVFNFIAFFFFEYSKIEIEDFVNVGALHFLLNALCAFGLNVSVVFLIGKTSSLVLTLSGVLKDILLVCASVILYTSPVSSIQVFGYGIALIGLFRYKTMGQSPVELPKFHWITDNSKVKTLMEGKKRKLILIAMLLTSLAIIFMGSNLSSSIGLAPLAVVSQIFVICPCHKTGGPEALHQLCNQANMLGFNASMVYSSPCSDELYGEYKNLSIAFEKDITASPNESTYIVIPEVYNPETFREAFPGKNIVFWWLSGNLPSENILDFLKNATAVMNAGQSFYAMDRVYRKLHVEVKPLFDFTRADYIDYKSTIQRKKLVAFNPKKDAVTEKVCESVGISTLKIEHMNNSQMKDALASSMVYVDMGSHPGKDRIPREAAILGNVVITNMKGSAAFYNDVPISEKVLNEEELGAVLKDVLDNYDFYYRKQENYRKQILNENAEFDAQIMEIFTPTE